jgi:hypothetical protein
MTGTTLRFYYFWRCNSHVPFDNSFTGIYLYIHLKIMFLFE